MDSGFIELVFGGGDSPHGIGFSSREDATDDKIVTKWLKSSDNVYSTCRNSEIVNSLESGVYSIFQDSQGALHAQKTKIQTDELYILPNDKTNEVVAEIDQFWTKADLFKQHKFKHKRGVIFYGPGGTGKTSLINILCDNLIKNGGLVFLISNSNEFYWTIDWLQDSLRVVEPNRPVIVIMEDIDKFCDGGPIESSLLAFLDGADSIDHCVTIATTNFFEELNELVLRPSRLDQHVEVDKPNLEVREAYLLKKGVDEKTAKTWAKDTEGYSLAELKELFSSVILLGIEYEKAKFKITGQAANITKKPKGNNKRETTGFKFGNK